MKTNNENLRRGLTLLELLVVISIVVVFAALIVPPAIGGPGGRSTQLQGISNASGIKKSLDLFAGDFDNVYPNDETAKLLADLQNKEASSFSEGELLFLSLDNSKKSSNFYFSQLMANGNLGREEEEIFFSNKFKKTFSLKRPNKDGILTQGECVWGYTAGLQQTSSSHLPIIFDSPIATGDSPRFSKRVWGEKVVVARLNNSTKAMKIAGDDDRSGIVKDRIDGDPVNIFAPENLEGGTLVPADLRRVGNTSP